MIVLLKSLIFASSPSLFRPCGGLLPNKTYVSRVHFLRFADYGPLIYFNRKYKIIYSIKVSKNGAEPTLINKYFNRFRP